LAHVLNCSRATATRLADSAALLTRLLPSTWEALADGQLDWPRARALAAELLDPAREVAAEVIAAVEAAVLPRAGGLSITGLRAAARRELLRHDAAAANRRRREAERAADVTLRPARDGLATLASLGPAPLTTAIWQTIDSYARMAKADGDPRSLGQLRVGVLGDLVLRPWDTSRPRSPRTSPWSPRWQPWSPAWPGTTPAPSAIRLPPTERLTAAAAANPPT
jgi:hypothetical protein